MHLSQHDLTHRGEPTTRVDLPPLTPWRRLGAMVRVAVSGFNANAVVLLALAPLALAAVGMAQTLDSPYAARLHGHGMLAIAQVFQIASPFYVLSAATMAALQRWRGARELFVAWVLVVVAARAVAQHQQPHDAAISTAALAHSAAAAQFRGSARCS